jgi:hypothetical protein
MEEVVVVVEGERDEELRTISGLRTWVGGTKVTPFPSFAIPQSIWFLPQSPPRCSNP